MAGEALVSVAAEVILLKLVSTVSEEFSLITGWKENLKNLSDKSTMILALLRDAQQRGTKEEAVILWLKNMKDAVYDVDDVLDGFAFEMLRRKMEIQNRMKSKARHFFSASNPIVFRFKMAHKVHVVNMALDRVLKQGTDLGLHQVLYQATVDLSVQSEFRQTHPFGNDSQFLGRKADKSKILDMLLRSESEENLSVVAIMGLAGLGKTTLAQQIYKDEGAKRYFDERIWVCVSTDFNVTKLLKQMADDLDISTGETSTKAVLIQKLNVRLSAKKYLLVLDDVWNTEAEKWQFLTDCLFGIGGNKGSKILVTTRSAEVVLTMQTFYTLRLEGLSDNDSWSLFSQKAFASGGAKKTAFVVAVGKRMVNRCKGVPLAIKTLGALLNTKREDVWSSIEQSDLWNLSDDESGIMPSLKLSFNYFPSPYLKQCFAYCSIFPKDYKFQKDNLIQLWIAQGFIKSSPMNQIRMEDTGNDYFNILLWNSFFQNEKIDMYGIITTCMMHDLVHDFALSISNAECSTLEASSVNDGIVVRHLSLDKNEKNTSTIPKNIAVKLRTVFLAHDLSSDFFINFKCLRVLSFEESYIQELPKSIGKLKNLRYLNVSNTLIKAFPISIIKLYNLQTIRLMECRKFGELPKELRSLISLTHICFDAEYGGRLQKMPIDMGRLTSLQTLSRFVVGHDKGHQIEELGSLNELRGELQVTNLERVGHKNEAKKANLLMKTRLLKLRLVWSSGREGENIDGDVLEGLQPPPNLRSLTIEEFDGRNFPSWMITANVINRGNSLLPDSLVEIRLINCRKCELIPTLGELPFLRFLELKGMDNLKRIGAEFYRTNNIEGSNSSFKGGGTLSKRNTLFPKLENFTLEFMKNLKEWSEAATTTTTTTEEGAMVVFPCLEVLTIKDCEELMTAPSHFPFLKKLRLEGIKSGVPITNICSGLANTLSELTSLHIENCETIEIISPLSELISLQDLKIWGCPKLSSIPSIHGLTSLRELRICHCDGISNLPIGLGSCTSLETLRISGCHNLICVVAEEEDLRELKSLSSLSIHYCRKLKEVVTFEFLTRLEDLRLGEFWEELESFPFNLKINQQPQQPIQLLPHLETLFLYGWPKLKSLPDQLQHLNALRDLQIWQFDGLEYLPDWLGNLSSLQYLYICHCKNVKYLPSVESMRRLTNLRELDIYQCPLLKEKCTKHSGSEWSKISHIPKIKIEFHTIQDLTASSSSS